MRLQNMLTLVRVLTALGAALELFKPAFPMVMPEGDESWDRVNAIRTEQFPATKHERFSRLKSYDDYNPNSVQRILIAVRDDEKDDGIRLQAGAQKDAQRSTFEHLERYLEFAGVTTVKILPQINLVVAELPPSINLHSFKTALLGDNDNILTIERDEKRQISRLHGSHSVKKTARHLVGDNADPEYEQVVPYGINKIFQNDIPDEKDLPLTVQHPLCIMDTGFDSTHDDLKGIQAIPTNKDDPEIFDCDGHGTHVAGTVVAEGNAIGVLGIFPGAPLHISKVFGTSDTVDCRQLGYPNEVYASDIIHAAIDCYERGAKIVSMSLGGPFGTFAEQEAFKYMTEHWDMLFVAAAGNTGAGSANFPAYYPDVISVAASDHNDTIALFSATNDQVDIAAPGVSVLSTVTAYFRFLLLVENGVDLREFEYMYGSKKFPDEEKVEFFNGACMCSETSCPVGQCARRLCIIPRGAASFYFKAWQCQIQGGASVVIFNNIEGELRASLGIFADDIAIPVLSTTHDIGQKMIEMIGNPVWSFVGIPKHYAEFDGTSMACPHVSGTVYLLWNQFPNCSSTQIKKALLASTLDIGDTEGWDEQSGHGLVQYWEAKAFLEHLGCNSESTYSPSPSNSTTQLPTSEPSESPSKSANQNLSEAPSMSPMPRPSSEPSKHHGESNLNGSSIRPSISPMQMPTLAPSPIQTPTSAPSEFQLSGAPSTLSENLSKRPSHLPWQSAIPSFAPSRSSIPTETLPEVIFITDVSYQLSANKQNLQIQVTLNQPVEGIDIIARIFIDGEPLTNEDGDKNISARWIKTNTEGTDNILIKGITPGATYHLEFDASRVYKENYFYDSSLEMFNNKYLVPNV